MLLNFTVKFRGLFSQKHLLFFLSVGWFILGNKSNFKRVTFPPTYSQSSIAGSFGLVQLWISDGHQNVLSELNLFQKILKGRTQKKFEAYDSSFSGALFLLMYELKQPCVSLRLEFYCLGRKTLFHPSLCTNLYLSASSSFYDANKSISICEAPMLANLTWTA